MLAHLAVIALAASALAADVKVVPLAGEAIDGELTSLNEEKLVVSGTSGSKTLAVADVLAVEFPPRPKPLEKVTAWIDLLDGSKLLAESYTAAAGKASVQVLGMQIHAVQMPTRSIAAVRFRQQDADIARQWKEIVSRQPTGDLLVVRKTSQRTVEDGDNEPKTITETALDELDGTILDVGPESVQFEFDGEKLDVKREKIEGLVYYYAVRREFAAPVCRLTDAGGSQWNLKSIELSPMWLKIATGAGAVADVLLSDVAKLDFSVGNMAYLADLEPDTGGGEPAVSLQPAAMAARFGRVFPITSRPPLGADRFRIQGKAYDHALNLHSPLALVYRVPEGFRKLHAVAGVDDSILVPGRFVLQILGDGKELFRHEFTGPTSRGPVTIDLDVSTVKRITVALDPADGQDIGDQLNLCEARLTK